MIKKVQNHIISLHRKTGLIVLYGAVMFVLGVGLNHIFSEEKDMSGRGELRQPQIYYDDDLAELEDAALKYPSLEGDENDEMQEYIAPDEGLKREDVITEKSSEVVSVLQASQEDSPVEEITKELEPSGLSEYVYETKVRKGQAFSNILIKAGLDKKEAYIISNIINKKYTLRNLRIGQKISVVFQYDISKGSKDEGDAKFSSLRIDEREEIIELSKNESEKYQVTSIPKILEKRIKLISGTVKASLYPSAVKAGASPSILQDFMKVFSFDVDFQRDIRKGQKFEMLYEELFNEENKKVRNGDMIYASLTVGDDVMQVYRYSPNGKVLDVDYFTGKGVSLRRSILKTPIDGAVISSPYGKRRHPISGYSKMHKGVDFAAPTGTPIYAGGDGKIDFIGRKGGYGNYLRIRHNSEYSTAYAHLHKFARGMKKSRKVKQGQIIAYVGSTGASTGPHLHYEILRNGKQINPMKISFPPGKSLKGSPLKKFNLRKGEIDELLKRSYSDEIN